MSISVNAIQISPVVKFKVKGSIKDEHGTDKPFSFFLSCERVQEQDIAARMKASDGSIAEFAVDFMGDVIVDWSDVIDDDKQPVPFSREAWQQLCRVPGLPLVVLATYREEAGARAKN